MWCIWALLRIAAGLTQENAEQFAASLLFQGRAMAEKEEER